MNRSARANLLTIAATLAAGAGLCWGQLQPQQTMQYPRQQQQSSQQSIPGMAPNGQSPALSDAQMQQTVQDQLEADPALKAAGVSATVTNGKVMLMGMVPDRSLKKRAAALARSVAGVRGVENLISVSSSASSEPAANPAASQAASQSVSQYGQENGAALEGRVTQALTSDPVLSRYAITARVNDRNDVILQGVVPSKMDKRQAQARAAAIPGVRKVENKLKVNPRATILNPNAPSANPATPAADQNAGAKPEGDTLADQDAAGTGTPVLPAARASSANSAASAAMPAEMQQDISDALQGDPVLRQYPVSGVLTKPGSVMLEGTVPTQADRKHAVTVVKAIPGVRHVDNKIQVNPSVTPTSQPDDPPGPLAENFAGQTQQRSGASANPASPQDVRTELQARLEGNPDLSGVAVYVSGHTVTLRGNVSNRAHRKQAVVVVKSSLPKSYTVRDRIAINKGMGNGYPPLA